MNNWFSKTWNDIRAGAKKLHPNARGFVWKLFTVAVAIGFVVGIIFCGEQMPIVRAMLFIALVICVGIVFKLSWRTIAAFCIIGEIVLFCFPSTKRMDQQATLQPIPASAPLGIPKPAAAIPTPVPAVIPPAAVVPQPPVAQPAAVVIPEPIAPIRPKEPEQVSTEEPPPFPLPDNSPPAALTSLSVSAPVPRVAPQGPKPFIPVASTREGDHTIAIATCQHETRGVIGCYGIAWNHSDMPKELAFKEGGFATDNQGSHDRIHFLGGIHFGENGTVKMEPGTQVKFSVFFRDDSNGQSTELEALQLHVRWAGTYGDIVVNNIPIS